jgi:hypothetical protein
LLTECVFCKHRFGVDARAAGLSVACPRCSLQFTAVPAGKPTAAEPPPPMPAAAPSAPEAPAAAPETAPPEAATAPAPAGDKAAPPPEEEPADADPDAVRRRLLGLSLVAPFLGVAAVACASSLALCGLVLPLSVAGLLAGLAAAALARFRYRMAPLLPAAGGALSGLVLLAALLFPGLLGPAYGVSRQEEAPDTKTTYAVALTGTAEPVAVGDSDWVDAGGCAVQQGGLRVQVVGASVGPVQMPGAATKYTKEKYLLVRLRVQRPEATQEFADAERPRAPSADAGSRPRLTDDAGKEYEPRQPAGAGPAGGVRGSVVFPVAVVEEALLFDPPGTAVRYLRLELPAAAWGGRGTFRFTIPRSMIRRASGSAAAAGPRNTR